MRERFNHLCDRLMSFMLTILGFSGTFALMSCPAVYGPEPVMYGPEPVMYGPPVSTMSVDFNYVATLAEIQKTWAGEYEGWDDVQQKNTKIRRLLILNPNNTYTNIIQGVLIESGKSDYVDFEHEKGRYSYNSRTKTITYTVESDSVLDYGKQKFDGYSGKKYYDHTDGNYNENVQFSYSTNGARKWITRDTYLQSLTDKTISIAFAMDPQNPDDAPRR